ncbi:hypothetical protein ACFX2I_030867 [Malus domestica]
MLKKASRILGAGEARYIVRVKSLSLIFFLLRNNSRANERNRRNERPHNFHRSTKFKRIRENMQNHDFQNTGSSPVPNQAGSNSGPGPANMGPPPPNRAPTPPPNMASPNNYNNPPQNNWNSGPPNNYKQAPPNNYYQMPPNNYNQMPSVCTILNQSRNY